MNDLVKDNLVVDNFIENLRHYADVQSQVGERERAIIVSKAARIIELLSNHCMAYNVGIPAKMIVNIINEKVV